MQSLAILYFLSPRLPSLCFSLITRATRESWQWGCAIAVLMEIQLALRFQTAVSPFNPVYFNLRLHQLLFMDE